MRRDLVEWLVMAAAVLLAAQTAAAQSLVELGAAQATASTLAKTAVPSAATTLESVRGKIAALPAPVDPDHVAGFGGGKAAAHGSSPGAGWKGGTGKNAWASRQGQRGGWSCGHSSGAAGRGWARGSGAGPSGWARPGGPQAMAHR
jgi:hypothetical protein